jgi:hypothetical protein
MRQPLGLSVLGGLVLSQLLTLYTTPIVYVGLENARAWVLGQRPLDTHRHNPSTMNGTVA